MIKEIKYPYKDLTNIERKRIELFIEYHLIDYKDIHVYYCGKLHFGIGYKYMFIIVMNYILVFAIK